MEQIIVRIHEYFVGYFEVLLSEGFDKILFFHLQQSHRQYPSWKISILKLIELLVTYFMRFAIPITIIKVKTDIGNSKIQVASPTFTNVSGFLTF